MAVYTTRIEADKAEAPVLLANGNLVAQAICRRTGISRSGTIPFPKPSYLFALVGGSSPASRTASAPCRAARSR
jgi:aminopeptidase N